MSRSRQAFDRAMRDRRDMKSAAYQQGLMAYLLHKLDGGPLPCSPYAPGTAQHDAWCSALDEGRAIVRAEHQVVFGGAMVARRRPPPCDGVFP
jgi:hypothetical protein